MIRAAFTLIIIVFIIAFSAPESNALDKAYLRWLNKKPPIDSIVINGNNDISTSEIKNRLYAREINLIRRLKSDRRAFLQRETIGRDTLEIKFLYYSNGYLNVQVRESALQMPNDSSKALLWINISEGRQYLFGSKTVNGDFQDSFRSNLNKIADRLKTEKPANPLKIRESEFEMKTYLANNGYPYARVTSAIDTNTSPYANIAFNVLTDSLVRFGRVTLEAMNYYPSQVAFRELKVKQGEVYKREKILQSQKRLYESGYFTFAQLTTTDNSGDRLAPDFQLRLKERKPYFTSVTTGAGQSEFKDLIWDFSFGIGKRNFRPLPMSFWGSHRVNVSADYSFALGANTRLFTHRYRVRYTLPWFFNIRMPVTFTGEWEPPLKFEAQDFKIRRYAFAVSSRKWFGEEFRIDYGLEYENIKISEINVEDIELIKEAEGISVRRQIYTSFRFDSRDNIFLPSRGALSDFSAEFFGGFLGGDDNFYRFKASWATYQKVWPGWILAVRFKGGLAREFGESSTVPSEERLYLGGASSIRGFIENSLGPVRDDGSAIGANITLINNWEFRWKTVQFLNIIPFFRNFPQWQSIFFDIGNGFKYEQDIKADNFAYSYGTGLQIVSPAGPIRIDYARRIGTDRYEVDSRWHFTILYAF